MAILNFIIDNILINAAVILGLVALLGLILQKKPFADCLSGTFKTMMGFMVLSAGANVIVGALEPFSVWFAAGLGIDSSKYPTNAELDAAIKEAQSAQQPSGGEEQNPASESGETPTP